MASNRLKTLDKLRRGEMRMLSKLYHTPAGIELGENLRQRPQKFFDKSAVSRIPGADMYHRRTWL